MSGFEIGRHGAARGRRARVVGTCGPSVAPPSTPRAFPSHDEFLDAAIRMFDTRVRRRRLEAQPTRPRGLAKATRDVAAWESYWHGSFDLTGDGLPLCRRCRAAGLDRTEREAVVAMLLGRLNLVPEDLDTDQGLVMFLGASGAQALSLYRSVSEGGRLAQSGIIMGPVDEMGNRRHARGLLLDEDLLDEMLHGQPAGRRVWQVAGEEELCDRLRQFTRLCRRKEQLLAMIADGGQDSPRFYMMTPVAMEPEDNLHQAESRLRTFYDRLLSGRSRKRSRPVKAAISVGPIPVAARSVHPRPDGAS